jgi:hypothetical protein
MRGLDPRIYDAFAAIDGLNQCCRRCTSSWIAGSSPAMTVDRVCGFQVLTLILYDHIPNGGRSARGRSHQASCGWDRMRRPRPGDGRSCRTRAAPGLRPAATTSRPPGAWPPGAGPPVASFAMGCATWRAISLALVLAGGIVENGDRLPRASTNNMGDNTCLAAT